MEKLKVENLRVKYKNFDLDLSFSLFEGEFVSIMGPSGSGKSTLLYILSGIESFDKGEVYLSGKEISNIKGNELSDIRRNHIGFVFQNPELIPEINVIKNILIPVASNRKEKINKAEELLKELGLKDYQNRNVNNLSGGEKQRVAIIRALINEPDIIFADEPTGALNQSATKETMELFLQLKSKGNTILMVTHDAKVASYSDRIIYLVDGLIAGEFINSNRDEEKVREFLSSYKW